MSTSIPAATSANAPATPTPTPRNIVILLDGTGNEFGLENTNLIKFMSVLMADDSQLVYYSSGVGTLLPEGYSTWDKFKQGIAKLTDKGLAWSFDDFVCDAYRYLMDYYRDGDQVYILGFSRGAYTARALAGMIQKVGLLPRGNYNQIKFAWKVYTTPDSKDDNKKPSSLGDQTPLVNQESASMLYRRIFGISRAVSVHFIGVWDTVSSLGGVFLPTLPFASGIHTVSHFRHALALDEHRARFIPEYRHLDAHEKPISPQTLSTTSDRLDILSTTINNPKSTPDDIKKAQAEIDGLLAKDPRQFAKVRRGDGGVWYARKSVECWFMGCHSDVGGGNDKNSVPSLSNIPFRWMLREAFSCGLRLDPQGIALQPAIFLSPPIVTQDLIPFRLRQLLNDQLHGKIYEQDCAGECKLLVDKHLSPQVIGRIIDLAAGYDSGDGDGQLSEDAMRPYTESLTASWILAEVVVLETRYYTSDGEDKSGADIHAFRYRNITNGQYIHRSVQKRLKYDHSLKDKDVKKGYIKYDGPKATLPGGWGVKWDDLRDGKGPMIWED